MEEALRFVGWLMPGTAESCVLRALAGCGGLDGTRKDGNMLMLMGKRSWCDVGKLKKDFRFVGWGACLAAVGGMGSGW